MVETSDLRKTFLDAKRREVRAVDGVTLQARPGEVFGLLGVNGAGKTTLLRMLSTVLRPTSGTGRVAGYDIATQSEDVRRSIGFMSSSTALYGRLTAGEMIAYFGGLYGLEGAKLKARLDEVIERLQLQEFLDRLCDKLSTGQRQRVSIARTILHDPPVLFFDEPTSGLDVLTSQRILEFIEGERTRGKTVVYCTHIMSEAERLCDHLAVIHGGTLRAAGTVPEVLAQTGTQSLEKAFLSLVATDDLEVAHA